MYGPDINFQQISDKQSRIIQQGYKEKFKQKQPVTTMEKDFNLTLKNPTTIQSKGYKARLLSESEDRQRSQVKIGPLQDDEKLLWKSHPGVMYDVKCADRFLVDQEKYFRRFTPAPKEFEVAKNCVPACQFCGKIGHDQISCRKREKAGTPAVSNNPRSPGLTLKKEVQLDILHQGKKNRKERKLAKKLKTEISKEKKVKKFRKKNFEHRKALKNKAAKKPTTK